MNHRHVYHRLAYTWVPFVILAQPPIAHESTKRPPPHASPNHDPAPPPNATLIPWPPCVADCWLEWVFPASRR